MRPAAPSGQLLALRARGATCSALTHIYTGDHWCSASARSSGCCRACRRIPDPRLPPAFDYYRMLTGARRLEWRSFLRRFFITGPLHILRLRNESRAYAPGPGLDRLLHDARRHRADDGRHPARRRDRALQRSTPRSRQARSSILAQRCLCSVPGASRFDLHLNVIWFKRMNPAKRIPLPAFIATNDLIMWIIATLRCRGGDGGS